jgi:AraC-like DNA-binding protein
MLSLLHDVTIGRSRYRTATFIERTFRGQLFWREHLTYDNRVVAAGRWPERQAGHIYAVVEGTTTVGDGVPTDRPVAYLLADHELEHVDRGRAIGFRTEGRMVRAIHLRIPCPGLRRVPGLAHGPLPFDEACWAALEDVLAPRDLAFDDEPVDPRAMARFLGELARIGVVDPAVAASVVRAEDPLIRARWNGAVRLYERFKVSSMLKKIALAVSLSTRQTTREVAVIAEEFGLRGLGLHEINRLLRLRAAAMLLSAPDGTATEVAHLLGYGTLSALGTAFRKARLPSPSAVRAALLGPMDRAASPDAEPPALGLGAIALAG